MVKSSTTRLNSRQMTHMAFRTIVVIAAAFNLMAPLSAEEVITTAPCPDGSIRQATAEQEAADKKPTDASAAPVASHAEAEQAGAVATGVASHPGESAPTAKSKSVDAPPTQASPQAGEVAKSVAPLTGVRAPSAKSNAVLTSPSQASTQQPCNKPTVSSDNPAPPEVPSRRRRGAPPEVPQRSSTDNPQAAPVEGQKDLIDVIKPGNGVN